MTDLFYELASKKRNIDYLGNILNRISQDFNFNNVLFLAEDCLPSELVNKYKDRMKVHLKNEIINLKREIEIELTKFKITKL